MGEKRVLEGYLHCIPFAGDRWILAKRKYSRPFLQSVREVDGEDLFERTIYKLFEGLEGKKVRITVEVLEEADSDAV